MPPLICSLSFQSILLNYQPIQTYSSVCARVTCYEATGYRTASMKVPKNGMVATSDRTIPLGSKVIIDGKTYTVEDRTAKWVDTKFKYHTIDIFSEQGCKGFGLHYKVVKIISN